MVEACPTFWAEIAAQLPTVPRSSEVGWLNATPTDGAAIKYSRHAKCAARLCLTDRAVTRIGHDGICGDFISNLSALAAATIGFGQRGLLLSEQRSYLLKR